MLFPFLGRWAVLLPVVRHLKRQAGNARRLYFARLASYGFTAASAAAAAAAAAAVATTISSSTALGYFVRALAVGGVKVLGVRAVTEIWSK